MDRRVIGVFENYQKANEAVEKLAETGFKNTDLNVVTKEVSVKEPLSKYDATGAGVAGGAIVGGLAGVLAGLSAATIPPLGPVLYFGTVLGTTVTGAGVGAGVGALVGALVDLGLPEDTAKSYVEIIKEGGILVAVDVTEETQDKAEEVMKQASPQQLEITQES